MKRFTLLMACLATLTAANAQKNLFDAADVDANGWLWLNTQAKIDKYVSQANNEDEKIDPAGKPIQLVSATFGDYEDNVVDPDYEGAASDGQTALKGGIVFAKASTQMSNSGGGIALMMPSCKEIAFYFSSNATMMAALKGSSDINATFGNYTIVASRSTSFTKLSSAGQYQWNNAQDKWTSGSMSLVSDKAIYAYLQYYSKYDFMLHGLKVITQEAETGIYDVKADNQLGMVLLDKTLSLREPARVDVYTTTGQHVLEATGHMIDLSELAGGVYIVKGQTNGARQTIKVAL